MEKKNGKHHTHTLPLKWWWSLRFIIPWNINNSLFCFPRLRKCKQFPNTYPISYLYIANAVSIFCFPKHLLAISQHLPTKQPPVTRVDSNSIEMLFIIFFLYHHTRTVLPHHQFKIRSRNHNRIHPAVRDRTYTFVAE